MTTDGELALAVTAMYRQPLMVRRRVAVLLAEDRERCTFDQESKRCIEHGGPYTGRPSCERRAKAVRITARIVRAEVARASMRLVWRQS